jgi:hypothetical protein
MSLIPQIRAVITPEFDALYAVERRLRADRRLGLQRRVGERRVEVSDVPLERRGPASRRDMSDRRSGQQRRIQIARLNFSPSLFPDTTV